MLEIPGIVERRMPRRGFLQVGANAALASFLNQATATAAFPSSTQPIRSCILLMLYGGPSHLDTWDMKPQAPAEIRGEYRPIRTKIPGRFVCEHLPQCANLVDRLAVVRSMHHGMANHNSAMYQALVGRQPKVDLDVLGANRSEDFPCMGSTVSYMTATGHLRPYGESVDKYCVTSRDAQRGGPAGPKCRIPGRGT